MFIIYQAGNIVYISLRKHIGALAWRVPPLWLTLSSHIITIFFKQNFHIVLTSLLRDSVKECFILVYNRYTDNLVKSHIIVIKILLLFAEDSAARIPACLWLERGKTASSLSLLQQAFRCLFPSLALAWVSWHIAFPPLDLIRLFYGVGGLDNTW